MAKQQIAKIEPQKAPYVAPRILTLKVNLSFASSGPDDLAHIFGLAIRPRSSIIGQKQKRDRANLSPATV